MADKKQILRRMAILCVIIAGGIYEATAFAADPVNGGRLYKTHCETCHGPTGSGSAMPGLPDFRRGEGLFQPDPVLVQYLEDGRGIKPAFRGLMSTQELLDVIAYLRTLH